MIGLLKVAGLVLGVALVGGCAMALSSDVSQVGVEPQAAPAATTTPVGPALQGNSPTLDALVPGEIETATFALG
jgi:hypothetical protein